MAKKLARYESKRDFSKTAEPSGTASVGRSHRLRFVVQKHAASRLHYDFRLELDGVFKSWAVTKGPSRDPHDRRLAVEVEDHPLAYGDFEGTIPQGQYGGGTVMVWDRGYWVPEGETSPDDQLSAGDLKFLLEGEKLKGGWVLVRMRRGGERRNNWLLIKHRDGAERDGDNDALLHQDRSVASGRTMEEIAAGKGAGPVPFMNKSRKAAKADAVWQSGGREMTKRAAVPRAKTKPLPRHSETPLPDFVAPQLCTLTERAPSGPDWVHEIKFDGYRIQLHVKNGRVTLRTRKGLDWTDKFASLASAATDFPDCIVDGEAVVPDPRGVPDFAALQAALSQRNSEKLIYFAFDLLYLADEDLRPQPLEQRKKKLEELLRRHRHPQIRYTEHMRAAGDAVVKSACRMSLEGIVSKRLTDPYRSGRAGQWTKTKCRGGQEVVIGGWSETNGNFRSLLVGVYRGKLLVSAGRVGTGFSREKLEPLLKRLKPLERDDSSFVPSPRARANVHWVEPKLVAEIEFAGWTADGQVRQASYKGLRFDKPAREVGAEHSEGAKQMESQERKRSVRMRHAVRAAPGPSGGTRTDKLSRENVMGIVLSHPDKPLWPDDGNGAPVTKLDLARFYESVGEWMIPHIRNRPCSIVRAPDGIDGQHFFQRHAMKGMSSLFDTVELSGDREAYLEINRIEALAAAAQLAALELHPWNSAASEPEIPGRLVFDLDPDPDVVFRVVVQAARELKERLEALGLTTFCKTTGGKGLHVVTPLASKSRKRPGWPEAKSFARDVCARMVQDSPDRYVINMAKKQRVGRIFLDYLRNDRTATAVAPLSPRARPGAPVSMPLDWAQVKSGLDPKRFTIRTAPKLVAASAAWHDYAKAEYPLADAIERFAGKRRG